MQRRHFQPRRRETYEKPVLVAKALVRAVSIRRRGPPGVLWQASTNTQVRRCELRRWQRDNPTEADLDPALEAGRRRQRDGQCDSRGRAAPVEQQRGEAERGHQQQLPGPETAVFGC